MWRDLCKRPGDDVTGVQSKQREIVRLDLKGWDNSEPVGEHGTHGPGTAKEAG